jgi:hypothetical protein
MRATFELKFGSVARFETAMERIVPAMEGQGWRLIGAYRPLSGDTSTAMHVWEIPDIDDPSTAAGRAIAADPTLMEEVGVLTEVLVREELEFLTPLSYNPSGG